MNNFLKKNWILITSAFILAIIAAGLLFNQSNTTITDKNSVFAVEDTSSITKVFLAKKDSGEVILNRQDNKWYVNDDYKASDEAVNILLETLKKLDVQRPVAKSEHDNVVKRLSSIGVKVEVYQRKPLFTFLNIDFFTKERPTKVFYVGDATKSNRGTYMVKQDAETPFVVYIPGFRGYLTPRFKAKPDKWRNHTIISKNINEIKSVEIHHHNQPDESFRIEKPDKNTFKIRQLSNNKVIAPFDTLKVLDFLSSFSSVNFEDLLNDFDKKDSVINTTPQHTIHLTDNQDKKTTIKTYLRRPPKGLSAQYSRELEHDPDRLYALFNNEQDFALVQYYTFDHLTRKISYFQPNLNQLISDTAR
ncbi:MAG: DUF4340 domain-containing protein [Bacteroidota bacterium]